MDYPRDQFPDSCVSGTNWGLLCELPCPAGKHSTMVLYAVALNYFPGFSRNHLYY